MRNQLMTMVKKISQALVLLGLICVIAFSQPASAQAAYSGGRMGGGSFRMPSRSYSMPRTYSGGGYSRGYNNYNSYSYGGGIGFPFLLPFLGFGGGLGGIFSLLVLLAVANFLVQNFRRLNLGSGNDLEIGTGNSQVTVAKVQVGLLAQAKGLQAELNQLANRADTGTATGRSQLLQETTLALLRHPEYWAYGWSESHVQMLGQAEMKFNQLALEERSKFAAETLSNFNAQVKTAQAQDVNPNGSLPGTLMASPSEYIVVTIVVGVTGKLALPEVNGAEELRQVLRQIGSVSDLLAVEILWTPQSLGDTLNQDDLMANYPNLKVV